MIRPPAKGGKGSSAEVAANTHAMATHDAALHQLATASGLQISSEMLSVVAELLRQDVSPQGVVALLRAVKDQKLKAAVAAGAAKQQQQQSQGQGGGS